MLNFNLFPEKYKITSRTTFIAYERQEYSNKHVYNEVSTLFIIS